MKNDQKRSGDPVEHWLRQSLGEFQPDVPDGAWERLVPNLPVKKERRRPVLWWMVAAIGAAFFYLLYCVTYIKSNQEPSKIASSEPWPLMEPIEPGAIRISPADLTTTTSVNKPAAQTTARPRKSSDKVISGKKQDTFCHFSPENTDDLLVPGERDFVPAQLVASTLNAQLSEKTFETLPAGILTPVVGQAPARLVWEHKNSNLITPKAKKLPVWIGFDVAPSLLFSERSPAAQTGLSFTGTSVSPAHGWQMGASFAVEPLKNWRASIGIQFYRQQYEAQHTAILRLMDGVCLNPGYSGLKEYEFQYALISGGESTDLSLRLNQQDIGSMMPNDEPFSLHMKTVHRSRAWRIPLNVERYFGAGHWRGLIKGGLVAELEGRKRVEVVHYSEACQDLCFQNGFVPQGQATTKAPASLGWLAGAGVEYRFGGHAALRVEPFLTGRNRILQGGVSAGLLFSY